MGLHLGWIPNEPGLRSRDYDQAVPSEPEPDPARVAALRAAQHARGMWARLLIVCGLFALVLFGLIAVVTHARWAWPAAGVLAFLCWLPVVLLGLRRRRTETRLRADTEHRYRAHAAELVVYEQGKQQWAESEAERIAAAPRWLQVAGHEDMSRLDVFGGTAFGRQNMVTGLGLELLAQRAVIVLDLSQDRVADGLLAAAHQAGITVQDYELPRDLAETPLLAGLGADEIASLIVEVVHADDAAATAAGRATDLMILRKVTGVLATDAASTDAASTDVTIGRLHAALSLLLSDGTSDPTGRLTDDERARLRGLFGDGLRHQVAGNLIRLAAVVEPLSGLGAVTGGRPAARLTCVSLADGPRDVAADLTAALVVQWVTRAVSASANPGSDPASTAAPPAVLLAGADEQSTRHLARLTSVCERHDIPLVRAFSRLTEESARHLDTRHTAFMRLATRPEAVRAAEHIGLERRFVAGKFAHRRGVSRLRTRTTGESVTHTTGRTEGEANTHTTGSTKGTAYSEREVPRQNQQINVHVEDHRREEPRGGGGNRPEPEPRSRESGRQPSGDGAAGNGQNQPAGGSRSGSKPGSFWGGSSGGGGNRNRGGNSGGASSLWGSNSGNSGNTGKSGIHVQSNTGSSSKPQVDIMRTNTRFSMQHESDAKTTSWSTSEEDSYTQSTSLSRTDGVSVGDEISYELTYDHKVQPETLMALPEDQMLAPHIVESASQPAALTGKATGKPDTESKMVALVIDPAVVGTEPVAPVHPGEIPAFEPPVPVVSAHVPAIPRGDGAEGRLRGI